MKVNNIQKRIHLLVGAFLGVVALLVGIVVIFTSYSLSRTKPKTDETFKTTQKANNLLSIKEYGKDMTLAQWVSSSEYYKSQKVKATTISKLLDKDSSLKQVKSMYFDGAIPLYTFQVSKDAYITFNLQGDVVAFLTRNQDAVDEIASDYIKTSSDLLEDKGFTQQPTFIDTWSLYAKPGYQLNNHWTIDKSKPDKVLSSDEIYELSKRYNVLPSALTIVYGLKSQWGTSTFELEAWLKSLYTHTTINHKQMVYTSSPEDFLGYLAMEDYPLDKNKDIVGVYTAYLKELKSTDTDLYGKTKPVYDYNTVSEAISSNDWSQVKPLNYIDMHRVSDIQNISEDYSSAVAVSNLVYKSNQNNLKDVEFNYNKHWWEFWKSDYPSIKTSAIVDGVPRTFSINRAKEELKYWKLSGTPQFEESKSDKASLYKVRVTKGTYYVFTKNARFVGVLTDKPKSYSPFKKFTRIFETPQGTLLLGYNTTGVSEPLYSVALEDKQPPKDSALSIYQLKDSKAEVKAFYNPMLGYTNYIVKTENHLVVYSEHGTVVGGDTNPTVDSYTKLKTDWGVIWVTN